VDNLGCDELQMRATRELMRALRVCVLLSFAQTVCSCALLWHQGHQDRTALTPVEPAARAAHTQTRMTETCSRGT
jgi:hypothetical protein